MSWTPALERESDLPVATQLVWRLRTLIAIGQVRPGERLPPGRELAQQVGVNANTIRAVYGRLEELGLVVSRQGSGTYVAPDAPSSPALAELAAAAEAHARSHGIEPRELAAALYLGGDMSSGSDPDSAVGLGSTDSPPKPDQSASPSAAHERQQRSALRAEIRTLDKDLARLPGLPGDPTAVRHRAATGRLLTVDELGEIRDDLRARVRAAEAYEDQMRRDIVRARRQLAREDGARKANVPAAAPRPSRVRAATGVSTARDTWGPVRVAWTGIY